MADLINVNWKEHRNYKYIEASDFDFDEIGEVIGSRKRFSEVVKLREKLSAMDEDDLRDLFSKRFIINAPTENDALLAMLALYDTISAASPGELIVEKNGSAMPMTFGGFGVSQDFPGMGADDDPQFTEQLSSRGNPRCVHINSAYMFSSVVTELDKQGEITFVLNVQSDSGMMSVFGATRLKTTISQPLSLSTTSERIFALYDRIVEPSANMTSCAICHCSGSF